MKVGVGADHHGFEMKQRLAKLMAPEGHEVVDFGNQVYDGKDDDRDFAIALARAVACGDIERGVAVCGRGVSLRAALRHDRFSARQGVEDDTMNVLCPGPRASRRLEVHKNFLMARFSGAERHRRRLDKMGNSKPARLPAVERLRSSRLSGRNKII